MLNSLWGLIAVPLGFIMKYCYMLVEAINLPVAYVFAMLLFTIATKILMFPLAVKQQRQTAISAAYKPLVDEINRKYAKDRQKQSEELQKLERDYGYKPSAGCLPMLIQFPIIFGLIEVIYRPLTYMIRIPKELVTSLTDTLTAWAKTADFTINSRMIENQIIQFVKNDASIFSSVAAGNPEWQAEIDKIASLDMTIGSINLWETPGKGVGLWPIVLVPIFSILTMLVSVYITSMSTGAKDAATRRTSFMMMGLSTIMFATFSFSFPAGFSLYWGFSNLVTIGQQFILQKMCNVNTIRAEAEEKIRKQKEAKKNARKMTVKNEKGETVVKVLSEDEMRRYRLQKAHEIDAQRYGSDSSDGE